MKKAEIIEMLINNSIWDGTTDKNILMKYSKEELKDMLQEMEDAENEYYNTIY